MTSKSASKWEDIAMSLGAPFNTAYDELSEIEQRLGSSSSSLDMHEIETITTTFVSLQNDWLAATSRYITATADMIDRIQALQDMLTVTNTAKDVIATSAADNELVKTDAVVKHNELVFTHIRLIENSIQQHRTAVEAEFVGVARRSLESTTLTTEVLQPRLFELMKKLSGHACQ